MAFLDLLEVNSQRSDETYTDIMYALLIQVVAKLVVNFFWFRDALERFPLLDIIFFRL